MRKLAFCFIVTVLSSSCGSDSDTKPKADASGSRDGGALADGPVSQGGGDAGRDAPAADASAADAPGADGAAGERPAQAVDAMPPPRDAAPSPALTPAPAGTTYVYVGSDRGIDILYMDGNGALTTKSWVGYDPSIGFTNASFMAIADKYIYVVSDTAPAGQTASNLFAFAIDPDTGALALQNSVSTGGPTGVHVAVDKQRRKLFVANFGDDTAMPMRADINTIAMFGLGADGKIGARLGPLVKAGRNPHAIYFPEPLGKAAYVPALAEGNIGQFTVSDTGLSAPDLTFSLVTPAPDAGVADAAAGDAAVAPVGDAAAGDARPPAQCSRSSGNLGGRNPGPRHMDFSANGRRAYLLTEYLGAVHLFDVAAADGKLQGNGLAPVQQISLLPPDVLANIDYRTLRPRGAEIYLHPTGKWLYATVRLDRCDYNAAGAAAFQPDREDGYVTRFVVDPGDGKLSSPQHVKVNKEPRYFMITPDGNFLLVVGQRAIADNVLVYKIDTTASGAGKLGDTPVGKATTDKTWDGREPNQSRSIVVYKK